MKNRPLQISLLTLIALMAGSLGYWLNAQRNTRGTGAPPAASATTTAPAVERLMRTPFATSTGRWQTLEAWRGKILVVNFWATWCPPCREEMPSLSALQIQYQDKNVQFVGISIDQVDKVREFQAIEKITYPQLMGSPDAMQLSSELGNVAQGLPFTVIINRSGQVDLVKTGIFTKAELDAHLHRLVAQ